QAAAEIFAQTGDGERRAETLKALSLLQMKTGRISEALATYQAGLEAHTRPTLAQRALRTFAKLPLRLGAGR
ncbi:MAG: hypothetical protein C4310_01470, partial [Chloroflexota bacterium]